MTAHSPSRDLAPARLFAPLRREFNRFFDELGDGFDAFTDARFAPRMDVVETDDALKVTAEVPGMGEKDLKITVDDRVLTISGEKSERSGKGEGARRVTERSYGRFSRSILLPPGVDPAKISASMKDGVLELLAPRQAGAAAKTIEIQSR